MYMYMSAHAFGTDLQKLLMLSQCLLNCCIYAKALNNDLRVELLVIGINNTRLKYMYMNQNFSFQCLAAKG